MQAKKMPVYILYSITIFVLLMLMYVLVYEYSETYVDQNKNNVKKLHLCQQSTL